MGFKTLIGTYGLNTRWVTFLDDGQVFEDIPSMGLNGFDRAASKADPQQNGYWKAYTYRDGSGLFQKPGAQFSTRLQYEKPGQMKFDLDSFYKCADVDGLRLEGAWTSYANVEERPWERVPVGQRPIFRFSKDGHFTDEGVFVSFLSVFGGRGGNQAGSGTYDIKDFSLTLHYADGRVKRVALTGFLSANPASQNDILYIARAQFRKIK